MKIEAERPEAARQPRLFPSAIDKNTEQRQGDVRHEDVGFRESPRKREDGVSGAGPDIDNALRIKRSIKGAINQASPMSIVKIAVVVVFRAFDELVCHAANCKRRVDDNSVLLNRVTRNV